MRLPVFALTGPVAGFKYRVGYLSHTRTSIPGIDGQQGEQSACQLDVGSSDRSRLAKCPDRGKLCVEAAIVVQIETKRNRSGRHGPINHIEPDDLAAAVDQEMLRTRPVYYPRIGRPCTEWATALDIAEAQGANSQHAWVNGRRPHRQH